MESTSDEFRPLFGSELTDRPLFGVSNRRDRIINLVVGCVSALLFVATLLSAFVAHRQPHGLNIYFACCICLICISHIILLTKLPKGAPLRWIYWYRQGDLDPKFRVLIYYNAFTMALLSICALSYFFTPETDCT